MTTQDYTRHTEELRDLRELFYRARMARGQRLSFEEARWVARRQWDRDLLDMPVGRSLIDAIANLVKTVREMGRGPFTTTAFPSGGDTGLRR